MLVEIYTDASPKGGGIFGVVVLLPETAGWAYAGYAIPRHILCYHPGHVSLRAELYAMVWAVAWAQREWPEALIRAHTDCQAAASNFSLLVGNYLDESHTPAWAWGLRDLAKKCDFRRTLLPIWLSRNHPGISACDSLAREILPLGEGGFWWDRRRSSLQRLEAFFLERLGSRSNAVKHVRHQIHRTYPRGFPKSKATR